MPNRARETTARPPKPPNSLQNIQDRHMGLILPRKRPDFGFDIENTGLYRQDSYNLQSKITNLQSREVIFGGNGRPSELKSRRLVIIGWHAFAADSASGVEPRNVHSRESMARITDASMERTFLNRYQAIRLLGEGGMGRVYLAKQLDPGRQVLV